MRTMNSLRSIIYCICILLLLVLVCETGSQETQSKDACKLLVEWFSTLNQGPTYPIVFEPIKKGRLTVWMGQTTVPGSDVTCSPVEANSTTGKSVVSLDFGSYVNKLEWTYFDRVKGSTVNGVSFAHCDNNKFQVSIDNQQMLSYLNCNIIDQLELIEDSSSPCYVKTSCQECSQHLTALINSYIDDLFKTHLNEHIVENLYWQISQLVTNQHFNQMLPVFDE